MRFKHWFLFEDGKPMEKIYAKQNAPDNHPDNNLKGKVLRLKQEIMDYVDSMESLKVHPEHAKSKAAEAFKNQINILPDKAQKELTSFINFLTKFTYRDYD
jgi:hypothetical protein